LNFPEKIPEENKTPDSNSFQQRGGGFEFGAFFNLAPF
jgi:hypothetical protein